MRAQRQINFAGDTASLSLAAEHDLLLIARAAQAQRDYILCVVGPAHAPSNPASNQRSNQRVHAVTEFLKRSGEVPPDRVLSASAMRALDIQPANHGSSDDPGSVKVEVLVRAAGV